MVNTTGKSPITSELIPQAGHFFMKGLKSSIDICFESGDTPFQLKYRNCADDHGDPEPVFHPSTSTHYLPGVWGMGSESINAELFTQGHSQ